MKIKYINPEWIFNSEKPIMFKNLTPRDHYDKSEIGMVSYLQILVSIALYGFKYVVVLNKSNTVIDGNYRVYAGKELGLKVPCIVLNNREGYPRLFHRLIWRLRHLVGIKYLFQRKFFTKDFRGEKNSLLVCKFQKNILEDKD